MLFRQRFSATTRLIIFSADATATLPFMSALLFSPSLLPEMPLLPLICYR
jgi:hypothetical protein